MVPEVLAVCVGVTIVMIVALCSCWKREQQKSEWPRLDGMVTPKNPDENVNHLPSIAEAGDEDPALRTSAITKTRRSLPDIPSENRVDGTQLWTEAAGDNTSDLYATVEQYPHSGGVKRPTIPNGIDTHRPSVSQHSSMSQADEAPYARVNYDKVKKENPYARVQNNHTEADENSSDEAVLLRPSTSQAHEPTPAPRSRRSSNHSSTGIDIPAATAVAGGIAANVELPYMTPPITQPNFSGDSQDSAKGYTSISVREPLEKIRAQTKQVVKLRDFDPHYSTVSDDSDEMYTTIQDPNSELYMSTSETYAQIMPLPLTVTAEVNPVPSTSTNTASTSSSNNDQQTSDVSNAVHLPTVDCLKQNANTHSRQASSSSSVGQLSSPKPEKRQANSPLPPPPPASTGSPDSQRSPIAKNLDDMYAKVHKNRKTDSEETRKSVGVMEEPTEKNPSEERPFSSMEHNYETLKKEKNFPSEDEPGYASINGPDSLISSDPGYEELKNSISDPNYETLRHRNEQVDGYSVVNKKKKSNTDYESLSTPTDHYIKSTDSESDPNYESVKYLDVNDPPYEKLSDEKTDETISKGSKGSNSELPYEKLSDDLNAESSGYENVKYSEGQVPGYETIKPKPKSEAEDPPYDTVSEPRIDGDLFEV